MENKKPVFGIPEASPINVVTELHAFFRDMQSYYKIAQGQLLGKLETTPDPDEDAQLKVDLQEVNRKVEYFHVLNNALSIADTVLHSSEMIDEFRPNP